MQRLIFSTIVTVSAIVLATGGMQTNAADPPDSPGAKITREKKLKAKISVDSSEGSGMSLREIIEEIKGELRSAKAGNIRISPDPKSGITLTTRIKFKSKNEPLEDVLAKMLDASGRDWGYYVFVSTKKDDQDDGAIIIINNATCRGYPPGDHRNKKTETKKEEPKKQK